MTKKSVQVLIKNLEVLARIGIHGHEQGKPQPVRINIWLDGDMEVGVDRLENAMDYEAIAGKIRSIIEAGHINLAETLAERVAAACFEDKRVKHARVRVEKLHALAGAEAAGVEIERDAP